MLVGACVRPSVRACPGACLAWDAEKYSVVRLSKHFSKSIPYEKPKQDTSVRNRTSYKSFRFLAGHLASPPRRTGPHNTRKRTSEQNTQDVKRTTQLNIRLTCSR